MPSVPPLFWIIAALMLGAIFGSFVNMAAYRLPRNISTWKRQRSFCPKCNHQLSWSDNIPILSFLILRGKCHYCRAPIPNRYLYAELLMSALFALSAYQYFVLNGGFDGPMPAAWVAVELFLIVDLVLLSIVDLEVWLIPWQTTLPWIPIGLLASVIFPDALHPSKSLWTHSPAFNALIDSFAGLVIGAGFLWTMNPIVALLILCRRGLMARLFRTGHDDQPIPEAMGMGDVHMLGMFGALLGWKCALLAILFGVIIGAVLGLSKIAWNYIQRRRLGDKWVASPSPTFDLPEDSKPFEPILWPLFLFGAIVLFICLMLNGRFNYLPNGGSLEFLAQFWLLVGIGVILAVSFPFYLYLKSINRLPGGSIIEKTDGKVEVYHGNYIPFGPSLAAGCLIVVFWEPLLRVFAAWFFGGITTPAGALIPPPAKWDYHVVGEASFAAALAGFFYKFNAMTQWLMRLMGMPQPHKP